MARMLAAVLLLAGTASAQAQVERDNFTISGWDGTAYYDERSDQFLGCVITTVYEEGSRLVFRWSYEGFSLVVMQKGWNLGAEGTEYAVELSVDRRWREVVTASVVAHDMVMFAFGHDQAAINAMRYGDEVWVEGVNDRFGFDLGGTNAGIQALQACFERHREDGGTNPFAATNPFGPPAGPAPGVDAEDDDFRLPPRLTLAQFEAFVRTHISAEAEVARTEGERREIGDYYFTAPGPVLGVYFEITPDSRTAGEQAAQWLAIQQQACAGRAASSLDQGAGGWVASAYLLCASGDELDYIGLVLASRPDRAQLLLISTSGDDANIGTGVTQAAMDGFISLPSSTKPRALN